ncbi:MAG: hypothetical protein ACFFCW_42320 [Candidatus Hodarchaeota archaeon]
MCAARSLAGLVASLSELFPKPERPASGENPQYVGFPKFKKKGKCKDNFRLMGTIGVFPATKQVQLPRLGKLRLKERPQVPSSVPILGATVSRGRIGGM